MEPNPELTLARITARSQRQAMDWSLVLVSQGIETAIDQAQDGAGWALLVAPQDYENALNAIRQYRLENRGWPWQREILAPGLLFDGGSLVWGLLVITFHWLGNLAAGFTDAGIMDSRAVAQGEWWRLFTAILLHADLGHLATNVTIGVVLLGLALGRYGTGVGLLAAYLAGAGGNLASWLLSGQPHRGLGASGMIMGALGLLAVQSFTLWRKSPHARKYVISGIGGGVMLFVLLGLTPGTDVVAHAGGFAGGLLLGSMLAQRLSLAQKPLINLASGLLFASLVVLTWGLALAQHH